MAPGGLEEPLANLVVVDDAVGISNGDDGATTSSNEESGGVQLTSFTEVLDDVTLHFQIIRLQKQVRCFSFYYHQPFFSLCPQFLHFIWIHINN